MHPATHAKENPDRAAYIMAGSGETVTYRQLDERSNQGAHFFRSLGLKAGDVIAEIERQVTASRKVTVEITWTVDEPAGPQT